MALDYERIRQDHKRDYGTRVSEYGKTFFEDMYAERNHFILELLQNAEDAIGRRGRSWNGPRKVSFRLQEEELYVRHFGEPFNESDVRGICSIDRSTKRDDLTQVGRFGIGFKSVYAFTDCPEVHSSEEHFAIDHYVWPRAVNAFREKEPEETVFIFPFRADTPSAHSEIDDGIRNLGAETLLFLKQIDEVAWENDRGNSGHYLRESESIDESVMRTIVITQADDQEEVSEEEWLVFFHQIVKDDLTPAGNVDIAFQLDPESRRFLPVRGSTISSTFPTKRETHFGFLVNGPYQTTLNRENVPDHIDWNRRLVEETASLLVSSLHWLRDRDQLDAAVLRCLPLSPDSGLLAPLFEKTAEALISESLLPRLGGGYVSARRTRVGSTAPLRELLSSTQLSTLFSSSIELAWLAPEITQHYPLENYVDRYLNVGEVRPETVIPRLSRRFLEAQSDECKRRR